MEGKHIKKLQTDVKHIKQKGVGRTLTYPKGLNPFQAELSAETTTPLSEGRLRIQTLLIINTSR